MYIRIADCYFYGIGVEKDFDEALEYYQKAEVSYISRLRNGDFMYKKQYERAIAMQQKCREEIQNNMPSYDWIKTDY